MDLKELLKSRGTKVGTGIVGGSGLIALALNVFSQRIDDVKDAIDQKETAIMRTVEMKDYQVNSEIKHLQSQVKEVKDILIRLDNRVYELTKKDLVSKSKIDNDYKN